MTKDNRVLATYVTYNALYQSRDTDVYDILSEFIKYIIIKEHKVSYSQIEIETLLERYFEFNVPSLVVKPAFKRIKGVTIDNKKYIVNYAQIAPNEEFLIQQQKSITDNENVMNQLIQYIEKKKEILTTDKDKIYIKNAFRTFILDEKLDEEYAPYISAFIIEKNSDTEFIKLLNKIREGHILYNGLCLNLNTSGGSWKEKMTIYLDMEILFHITGYNGSVFEKISKEFWDLIADVNIGQKYIDLKYFEETKMEVEKFFEMAESICRDNQVVRPGNTAMESIINGSKCVADIIDKKMKFYTELKRLGIYEENSINFYQKKYHHSNLESLEISVKNKEDIKFISHINKLRDNDFFSEITKSKAIFLSETGAVLELSRQLSLEKEQEVALSNGGNKTKIAPYALNLFTITNYLWCKLNKSFKTGKGISSANAVIRAQIVLSKYINDSVVEQYNDLLKKKNEGLLDSEQLLATIVELRRRSQKPENMIRNSVDEAIQFVCERDIDQFLEDYHSGLEKNKQMEQIVDNVAKELDDAHLLIDTMKNQLKIKELELELKSKEQNLHDLKLEYEQIQIQADKEANNVCKVKRFRRNLILISSVTYYVLLVILIIIFTWDVMEPITYVLGLLPLVVILFAKFDVNIFPLKEWCEAPCNGESYDILQTRKVELEGMIMLQKRKISEIEETIDKYKD